MDNQFDGRVKRALWFDLAQCEYTEICHLQERLHQKRLHDSIPDVLLFLEHFPCITIGSAGGHHNILASNDTLEKFGITVHETSRGGNVTYHGPGQLICYPILSLEGKQRDLHAYAHNMEEVIIRTLQHFAIKAGRKANYPGVWVGGSKIGALGIAVRKWTTMHGVSLNVCPDFRHFSCIVPCGISGHGVTSMEQVLGHTVDCAEVRMVMCRSFADIFQMRLDAGQLQDVIEENIYETA